MAHNSYKHHEIFGFMVSLLAMSFGDRFCFSRKCGTGGGGCMHLKDANNMTISGFGCKNGTWRVVSPHFVIKQPGTSLRHIESLWNRKGYTISIVQVLQRILSMTT